MNFKRDIYDTLISEIDMEYISILTGPRQVGKTYLLKQIENYCKENGKKTAYYDLETPHDLLKFSENDSRIIDILTDSIDVVFIDEFQYIKNATKILKIIHDSKKRIKIFASGSSTIEIHKHLKESLAGRYRQSIIYPLAMHEIESENYFEYGGLPGLIHEKTSLEKMRLLQNILQTYLMRDIKGLIKAENIRAFNNILYLLAQNQGSVISLSFLAKEVGLSKPTISMHLELMSQTYVCYPLESYSVNLANELKKSKKYYLYDLGIRNSILNDFSLLDNREDKGAIVESYIFLSLKKQLYPNMELKFWRTRQGEEIDFILLYNRQAIPIEVKYSIRTSEIPKNIKFFLNKYPKTKLVIIFSNNYQDDVVYNDTTIKFCTFIDSESIHNLINYE
jgi:uncharacterized protein